MAADTTLSITQVELGLAKYFDLRKNIIVTNVSWGMLLHEADLLILSKSGYLTEVEIKRSWSDFLADFKKTHTHDDPKISWHYYAVPESIVDRCKEKLAEVDNRRKWGLISYADWNGECMPTMVMRPSNHGYHSSDKRLYIEEQLQLARLGAMRVWNQKQKLIDYETIIS